jgi:peptidoglycan/LPS O-acetylase OafA/YrhL
VSVQQNVSESRQLAGIDLFRGISAFGVIYMHSCLVVERSRIHPLALGAGHMWIFAVPFFLITSIYFAVQPARLARTPGSTIRRHARHLLLPYLLWTIVYLALRVAKYAVWHRGAERVVADPVGILLGGTAVHLYFIPLLFVGLVLARAIGPSLHKLPSVVLALLTAVFVVVDHILERGGNAFNQGTFRAFEALLDTRSLGIADAPLRLTAVILAHGLRCMPLILIAVLLVRHLDQIGARLQKGPLLAVSAILLTVALIPSVPWYLSGDLPLALASFLVAWSLSGFIRNSAFTRKMGELSYGIYLGHQVILEVLQQVLVRAPRILAPSGLFVLLGASLLTFAVMWWMVVATQRHSRGLQLMWGLH